MTTPSKAAKVLGLGELTFSYPKPSQEYRGMLFYFTGRVNEIGFGQEGEKNFKLAKVALAIVGFPLKDLDDSGIRKVLDEKMVIYVSKKGNVRIDKRWLNTFKKLNALDIVFKIDNQYVHPTPLNINPLKTSRLDKLRKRIDG
ncbi:MAG: hypothetical protein ACSNEK_05965 [Parachlamydiaceae bacterium]